MTRNTLFAATALAAALLAGGPALAQYTGPSSVAVMTVKQVLDTAKDDQHVMLRGRIVSHDGGEDYTFADDSGRLAVEIDTKLFPAGQPIDANTRVELSGEYDKELVGTSKLDVKQLRVLP